MRIFEHAGHTFAEVISDATVIHTPQNALDIMANAMYQGANGVLVSETHLMPTFFDLKTGVAGEILQKFTNYRIKLIVMGDFSEVTSKSLRAFMTESNRGNQIAFVNDRQAALEKIESLQS